jgi:hypothetical protein
VLIDTGLIMSLFCTIIFGAIAIWLSPYFYRENTKVYNSMRDVLEKIRESSKVSEVASRDVLHPVVETMLGVVRESTRRSIDSLGQTFMYKAAIKLDRVLKAETTEEREVARESFIDEINSLFGTLRHEVGKVDVAWEPERALATRRPTIGDIRVIPGSPTYNWTPFIRRIRDMQKTHKFLSVKWLREKKFALEPEYQEALQVAIDRSMLGTYYRNNPDNPEFPTLCCKLNPDNEIVRDVLESITRVSEKTEKNEKKVDK